LVYNKASFASAKAIFAIAKQVVLLYEEHLEMLIFEAFGMWA
jgi:hypothetical protein